METIRNASKDRLFRAVLQLKNVEECYAFFEDICTIKEVNDMAQRLDTAVLLARGESYQAIAEEVGISTATISRVSRCLNYGNGGYKTAIERLSEEEK